jgi:hypothetical protein
LRGARHLTYADALIKNFLITLLHLAVMTATLCGRGGVRAIIAGESPAQAATDRASSWSPASAQPDTQRLAAVWIRIARPQSRTNPTARYRHVPLDNLGVSCRLDTSQVLATVLVDVVPEEARPDGADPVLIQAVVELNLRRR